jgi:hypothetical protein
VSETAILLRLFFSPSHYEVFVPTEDAASGIFFKICRKRVITEKEEYRILVKLLKTNLEQIRNYIYRLNKLGTISIA